MRKIYFLSSNKYKIQEVQDILSSPHITVEAVSEKINEIQSDQTFAEMGTEKNKISMRRIALEKLKKYLEDQE